MLKRIILLERRMKVVYVLAVLILNTLPGCNAAIAANVTDHKDCMPFHKHPWLSKISGDGDLELFHVDPSRYVHTVHTKAVKFGFKHANLVRAFIPNEQRPLVQTLNNRGGFEIACKENECA